MQSTPSPPTAVDDPGDDTDEADVVAPAGDVGPVTEPEIPTVARHNRRSVIFLAVAVVLAAALIGWGLHTRAQDAAATRRLQVARAGVHRTVGDLLVAEVDLSTTKAQRTKVTGTLATETSLLRTTESQLAGERTTLSAQGIDITDLTSCLSGVQEALNAIALDDVPDAVTSLEGVATQCQDAEPAP